LQKKTISKSDLKTQLEIERLKQLGIQKKMELNEERVKGKKELELCKECSKLVDPMERFSGVDGVYHKSCFRCNFCSTILGFLADKDILRDEKENQYLCQFCFTCFATLNNEQSPFSITKTFASPLPPRK